MTNAKCRIVTGTGIVLTVNVRVYVGIKENSAKRVSQILYVINVLKTFENYLLIF